jgi:hypothetical protein
VRFYNFDNRPAVKRYRLKREMWQESLAQETYTILEAAKAMKMGKGRVSNLVKSGELYHESFAERGIGERGVVIPRGAILRYMVGPHPMEGWLERLLENSAD